LIDEIKATGAVLAGPRAVEQVDHWQGDHRGIPDLRAQPPTAASVSGELSIGDVRDGRDRERDGAGQGGGRGRDVLVHGAYTAQRALETGVLDELQIHHIPVLFGGGRRLEVGGRCFAVLAGPRFGCHAWVDETALPWDGHVPETVAAIGGMLADLHQLELLWSPRLLPERPMPPNGTGVSARSSARRISPRTTLAGNRTRRARRRSGKPRAASSSQR
jgi:hypothetical protein